MRQPNDDHFSCERRCNTQCARAKTALLYAAVIGALSATLGAASAATEVRGQPDEMQLRAENASTREVLDALSVTFKLTYKLPPNIGRNVTGLYSGTLHQVLGRILDGNDYIVKVSDNGVEVVVLGASAATAIAASGQVIARSENTTAPAVPPSRPTASTPTLPASAAPPPLASYLSVNGTNRP
jgi:hypothetical protein